MQYQIKIIVAFIFKANRNTRAVANILAICLEKDKI